MRRSFYLVEIRTMHPSPYIIIVFALNACNNACNNPTSFIVRMYYDRQLSLLFQYHVCEIDRYTKVNKWSITIEYISYTVDVQ